MTLLRALDDVIAFLEEQAIPYAVIGGLAVQHWGEPRMTRDVGPRIRNGYGVLALYLDTSRILD